MYIKINEIEKDPLMKNIIYGKTYFAFNSKYLKLNWFANCEDWIIYILVWSYYIRFSGAGFMKGKIRRWK